MARSRSAKVKAKKKEAQIGARKKEEARKFLIVTVVATVLLLAMLYVIYTNS